MYEFYQKYLANLKNTGKYRKLPAIDIDRTCYLDFSSNDYLCLSKNQQVIEAAHVVGRNYGVGATGSRLLSGNSKIIEELETKIARDKKTEASLIFPSGFQANFTVLSSLLDQKILKIKPIVFFDKANHASLYQAAFLTEPELVRYKHNNIEHLNILLEKYRTDSRPKFIVTETVFGMDGDMLPIKQIVELAYKHNVFLYLDEAHATGLIGKKGYGLSTTINLKPIKHLVMGTFSKALGVMGGYIACDSDIKSYLINKSSGFIYSTAISPMLTGAANKAWDLVAKFDEQRITLFKMATYLRERLVKLGFDIGDSNTHIVPIILNKEQEALKIYKFLSEYKIITSYIRPPTVPIGTSRIRIALNISHTKEDIAYLVKILEKL